MFHMIYQYSALTITLFNLRKETHWIGLDLGGAVAIRAFCTSLHHPYFSSRTVPQLMYFSTSLF